MALELALSVGTYSHCLESSGLARDCLGHLPALFSSVKYEHLPSGYLHGARCVSPQPLDNF